MMSLMHQNDITMSKQRPSGKVGKLSLPVEIELIDHRSVRAGCPSGLSQPRAAGQRPGSRAGCSPACLGFLL